MSWCDRASELDSERNVLTPLHSIFNDAMSTTDANAMSNEGWKKWNVILPGWGAVNEVNLLSTWRLSVYTACCKSSLH